VINIVKKSKIIPVFLLIVFAIALIGIFISNMDSRPDLLDDEFLSLVTNSKVRLKDIIVKYEFVLVVFFRAEGLEDFDRLNNMVKFNDMDIGVNKRVVMLGIDGDFDEYLQFLIDNPKIFLSLTWLHTDNTNYFNYIVAPNTLNIYVFWMEDGEVMYKYLGSDLTEKEIKKALDGLGFTE